MTVRIAQLEWRRVAAVRHVGPYMNIGEAFTRLHRIAAAAGLSMEEPGSLVAIYYDDPRTTPAEALRSDAGLVISESTVLPAGLTAEHFVAGPYATTTYRGPYSGLPAAWAGLLGEGLSSTGRTMAPGPNYEIYRNTPMDTAPQDLVTELYVPVTAGA